MVSGLCGEVRVVQKLGSLEFGRGIAALAVVAHHSSQASDAFSTSKFESKFSAGALGVDFFFVLSGFIIYHGHYTDPKGIHAAKMFFGKRVRRIYIPYLPISLLMIVAYTLLPSLSEGNRDWGLFTSLTLLPSSYPPALSVAWTLVFEMIFYIIFLGFYFTRHFWLLVSVWLGEVILSAAFGLMEYLSLALIKTVFDPLVLEFAAGMIAAFAFSRLPSRYWVISAAIGLVLTVSYFAVGGGHRVLFGLSLAPLVLGLALAETQFRFRVPSSLLLLGGASYAIYLIHNPLQSLIARAVGPCDI